MERTLTLTIALTVQPMPQTITIVLATILKLRQTIVLVTILKLRQTIVLVTILKLRQTLVLVTILIIPMARIVLVTLIIRIMAFVPTKLQKPKLKIAIPVTIRQKLLTTLPPKPKTSRGPPTCPRTSSASTSSSRAPDGPPWTPTARRPARTTPTWGRWAGASARSAPCASVPTWRGRCAGAASPHSFPEWPLRSKLRGCGGSSVWPPGASGAATSGNCRVGATRNFGTTSQKQLCDNKLKALKRISFSYFCHP